MEEIADTQRLVKKAIADENTEDFSVDSITLSLTCPLKKARIRVPCRGDRCEHVQTFDAMAYLELNECTLRPMWRCPVCDRSIKVEELKVDLFVLELLQSLPPSCGAVKLLADGKWEPVIDHQDVILIEESPTKPRVVGQSHDASVIDLTGDTSSGEDD
ncbi:unnamed protein product [Ixodes hexagonus]